MKEEFKPTTPDTDKIQREAMEHLIEENEVKTEPNLDEQGEAMEHLIKTAEAETDPNDLDKHGEATEHLISKTKETGGYEEKTIESTETVEKETEQIEKGNKNQEERIDPRLNLEITRKIYAEEVIKNTKKNLSGHKELDAPSKNDDLENLSEEELAKENYLDAIKKLREEMLFVAEADLSDLSEIEKQKKLEKISQDIVKETVVTEANKLYDQKTALQLEAKGDDSKIEKTKKFASKIIEKYREIPLTKKLLLSAGLFAGGMAAGTAGGATGVALATGIITGKWLQRSLGGAATAIGLEGLIKRSQEKKEEKETMSALADGLIESIKNNDKKLDERLLELEGDKTKQKYWRYLIASSAGALIGSGLVGKAILNVIPNEWASGTDDLLSKTEDMPSAHTIAENYSVNSEDNLWGILKEKIPEISELERSGAKDNVVANLIEKIKDDPEAFGITSGDVDNLKIGDEIEIEKIQNLLENEKIGTEGLIEHAQGLGEGTLQKIENYQSIEHLMAQAEPEAINNMTAQLTNIGEHRNFLNIFGMGTDQFMETDGEWDQLKNLPAVDVLKNNFNYYDQLNVRPNGATSDNIKGLSKYLNEALNKIGSPEGNENIKDYLKRYEINNLIDTED